MVGNSEPFDIIDDSDLTNAVRAETGYDDGKIAPSDFDSLIDSAKRDLALMADVTNFYDDRGTAVALWGILCVKAKGHVENQPVVTDNLGPDDVTFRTTDGSSLQVHQYEQSIQRGLSNADNTDAGTTKIRFTNTYQQGDVS
jgi:hypothetical protein